MPYCDIGGERVFYALQRNGAGCLTVLLIHGAGENHLIWPGGLRRLPEAAVYAIDLPGHGKSSGKGRSSIEDYAAWLITFVDVLQLGAVVLIGHSMGGAVAQSCALKYPDRVTSLVLIAASARLRVSPQLLDLAQNDFPAAVDLISQWEWGPSVPDEVKDLGMQQLLATDPDVMLHDYRACDAFDLREQLGAIATPSLIIAGGSDRMMPLKHVEWMVERLPHARLITALNAGHMVMLEAEDQVVNAVEQFLCESNRAAP